MEFFTNNREGDTLSLYLKSRLDTKMSPIIQEAVEPLLDVILMS